MGKFRRAARYMGTATKKMSRNQRVALQYERLESRQLLASDLASNLSISMGSFCDGTDLSKTVEVAKRSNDISATSVSAAKLTAVESEPTHSYFSLDKEVGMVIHPTRVAVHFVNNTAPSNQELDTLGIRFVRPIGSEFAVYEQSLTSDVSIQASLSSSSLVSKVAPVFVIQSSNSEAVLLDEVIVALKPGVSAAEYFSGHKDFSAYRPLPGTPDQFIGTVAAGTGEVALDVANSLNNDPQVAWTAPNFYQAWQKYFVPDDARFTNQWHLNNVGQGGGLVDADVDMPEAWDLNPGGSSSIVIGVIDDGVDINHPDIDPWTNPGEIAGDGIDNDLNGWVDDIHGWNFVANNPSSENTTASDMHGTSVSGVAAARGNNGTGVAGASYNSKVLSARMFEGNAVASDANIAAAIYYTGGRTAAGTGTWNAAAVVNNSWGGGGTSAAINAALVWGTTAGRQGQGATYLFATGNGFGAVSEPAVQSLNIPGVVAVGATNNFGERSDYSNYGIAVDIVTPSNDTRPGYLAIDTTDRVGADGYDPSDYTGTGANGFGGTSSATPLASGIVALMLAEASAQSISLTPAQVRGLLRNNTDLNTNGLYTFDASTGKNIEMGYGRLNAASLLSGLGKAEISVTSTTSELLDSVSTVAIGSVIIGNFQDVTYRVRNQGTSTLNLSGITASSGPISVLSSFSDPVLALGESTTFTLRFTPTAAGNFSQTISIQSDDLDEALFTFDVSAVAISPSVSGLVFEDWDGDGVKDADDVAQANQVVYVDENGNDQFDSNLNSYSFSNATPLPIVDLTASTSTMTVSGLSGFITDINLKLNITHTWVSDLDVTLISPTGMRVVLVTGAGGSDDDFIDTVFDDQATASIQTAAAPFTGSFVPFEPLAGFLSMSPEDFNGDWSLEIEDFFLGDEGTLSDWELTFSTGEQNTAVNANGFYAFVGLPNGTYSLRPALPAGWTSSVVDEYSITIVSPNDSFQGRNFGSGANNQFYGMVFDDKDNDGLIDANESGLVGRQVFLDLNSNGVFDAPGVTTLSNNTPVTIPDVGTVTSTITSTVPGFLADVNVVVNITHSWDSDVDLFLVHPDGTRIELFTDVGGSADNFVGTVLDQEAANPITSGTAPFTGTFRPEGNLGLLYGKAATGDWTLEAIDDESLLTGTLDSWSLELSAGEYRATTAANGRVALSLPAGASQVRLEPFAGYEYTQPVDGLIGANAINLPVFNQRFGTRVPNALPVLTVNSSSVTGTEGTTITNSGTWSDANASDVVTLSASVGTIVKNNDGTWSWSFSSPDQVATTSVTVTANDGAGGITTLNFTYAFTNLAPTLTVSSSSLSGNVLTTFANSGTYGDVPADTVSLTSDIGTVVRNNDGTWSWSYVPSTAVANQTVTVTATDEDGGSSFVTFTITAVVHVATRGTFYKNATGSDASTSLSYDKVALLPGQTSTFANYTNYSRGLNGVVIDIAGLPSTTDNAVMTSNIQLSTWNGIDTTGFVALPGTIVPTIAVLGGAGALGSTRVRITFADNAISNTWLRVTVLANASTGLTSPDVFYFGNVIGDVNTGNTSTRYRVNSQDTSLVRNNQSTGNNSVNVTSPYDLNRDGRVNSQDTSIVRNNQQTSGIVAPITAPSNSPPGPSFTPGGKNGSGSAPPVKSSGDNAGEAGGLLRSVSQPSVNTKPETALPAVGATESTEFAAGMTSIAVAESEASVTEIESLDLYFAKLWKNI